MNIASIIQSASLNRHPSPTHDVNPSTAASIKQPVSPTISISSDDHSIPYSALKPVPRRSNLPPLPDLRFEQSYLASLRAVEGWRGVLWVTARDQVCRGGCEYFVEDQQSRFELTLHFLVRCRYFCHWCRAWHGRLLWQAGDTGIKELRLAEQVLGGK